MQISRHTVVTLAYRLTDDEGTLLDASGDGEPLAYIHDTQSLIPGLERALTGRSVGEKLDVRLPPEEAYGERDESLTHEVGRDELPADAEISVGLQLHAESEDGEHILTVVAVDGDRITMDANHPLAGKALNFAVTVLGVRAATREELAHGHVHGADGHHH